jgi:hypothetical protein
MTDVIAGYLRSVDGEDGETVTDEQRTQRSEAVAITHVAFENSEGERTKVLRYREAFTVRLAVEVRRPIVRVRVGVGIDQPDGIRVATSHHTDGGLPAVDLEPGRYTVAVRVDNTFVPGRYVVCAGLHELRHRQGLDFVPHAATFMVLDADDRGGVHEPYNVGVVDLETCWSPLTPAAERQRVR